MNRESLTNIQRVTRRRFFGSAAHGIGIAALASLLGQDTSPGFGAAAEAGKKPAGQPGLPGCPHFAPKAKRVVCMWQGGGPSHLDLFDPKPMLGKMAGKDIPDSVRGATRLSTMSSGYKHWPIVPALKPFKRYGKCGLELSEMLPQTGSIADDICLVRSMNTEAVNHAPGVTFFMTGRKCPAARAWARGSATAWAAKRATFRPSS